MNWRSLGGTTSAAVSRVCDQPCEPSRTARLVASHANKGENVSDPTIYTPFVPGTREPFMFGLNCVEIHYYPETGAAYMYAGCGLLSMYYVACMSITQAQLWATSVLNGLDAL